MSTIDPTVIDPSKPPPGSGDPNNPTNYTTAEERQHKSDVQDQFANAKTDVEALEAGKANTSTTLLGVDSVTGGGSLAGSSTFALVSDETTPGANKVYGTNGAGSKGWKDDPIGVATLNQWEMYARLSATAGAGEPMVINSLTNVTSPAGTESLLAMLASGQLVRINVSNLPSGGAGGETNISTTPATIGANEADVNMPKVGADLQKRKLAGTVRLSIVQFADSIAFDVVEAQLNHDNLQNYDAAEHFTEASIDHANIQNNGTNTHAQLDSHVADGTLHYAQGAINHNNILNRGSVTHANLDAHVIDGSLHFTEASIDHTNITNRGTNTHAQIDTHIGDASVHFPASSVCQSFNTRTGPVTPAIGDYTAAQVTNALGSDFSSNIDSDVGYSGTARAVASGGTFTPNPEEGQFVQFTGTSATIINTMALNGTMMCQVPLAVATAGVTLSGWVEVGSPSTTIDSGLYLSRVGTLLRAIWY